MDKKGIKLQKIGYLLILISFIIIYLSKLIKEKEKILIILLLFSLLILIVGLVIIIYGYFLKTALKEVDFKNLNKKLYLGSPVTDFIVSKLYKDYYIIIDSNTIEVSNIKTYSYNQLIKATIKAKRLKGIKEPYYILTFIFDDNKKYSCHLDSIDSIKDYVVNYVE